MNKFHEFIAHGLHRIQQTFFPDLEHEAGPIPETLVKLAYVLETVHSQKSHCLNNAGQDGRQSLVVEFSTPLVTIQMPPTKEGVSE